MRVVATSAWLTWLSGSELGRKFGAALPATGEWIAPTIVQVELARLASSDAAEQAFGFSTKCVIVPVDTNIALPAAGLARDHKLATADAIPNASATRHGADLLTRDAHFANPPGIVHFPKSAP